MSYRIISVDRARNKMEYPGQKKRFGRAAWVWGGVMSIRPSQQFHQVSRICVRLRRDLEELAAVGALDGGDPLRRQLAVLRRILGRVLEHVLVLEGNLEQAGGRDGPSGMGLEQKKSQRLCDATALC